MSSELSVSETTLLRRPESATSEEVSSSTALLPSSPNRSDRTSNNNNNFNNTTTYSFTIKNSSDKKSPASSVSQLVVGGVAKNINTAAQQNIEVILNHNNSISSNSNQSDIRNMETNKRVFYRVGIDVLILLCVGFPILFFHLWGDAYKRGFFCDDESLKHPFKDSTVKNWMLYFIGILLPIGTILIVEIIKSNNAARQSGGSAKPRYIIFGYDIPDWMVEAYKKIGCFAFGAAVSQLTTDIAKYSIGRLRPHFFSVCQPVLPDGTNCDNPANIGKYITEFSCQGVGSSSRMLKEMRLSFPSGHSSFTFYTMVFTALYLQSSMTWRGSKLLRHFLQFLFIMIAWFTALSRISDYKHHWSDVLAGATLGSLSALLVANFVSDMFKKNAKNSIVLPTTSHDLPNQTIALNGH